MVWAIIYERFWDLKGPSLPLAASTLKVSFLLVVRPIDPIADGAYASLSLSAMLAQFLDIFVS